MTARVVNRPDPAIFPEPHRFATYIAHRSTKFKTHSTLALAKNAISGKAKNGRAYGGSGRIIPCDAFVYEWAPDTGWVQLHHIPRDSNIDDHEFYKVKAPKGPTLGPSEASVEAAIQSIMGQVPEEGT